MTLQRNGRPALSREPARDENRFDRASLTATPLPNLTRLEREADGFRAARRLVHDARRALRWQQETATSDDAHRAAVATRSALGLAAQYLLKREKHLRRRL